jgi:branched-chain amino acid aminotransferase
VSKQSLEKEEIAKSSCKQYNHWENNWLLEGDTDRMLKISKCEKHPKVQYQPHPRFGTVFTPHMLRMQIDSSNLNDLHAEILPFGSEKFKPSTIALHYGQSIFEGMKVFRQKDGGVAAFRADLHAARFMFSAAKLAMPLFGEKIFLECLREYMNFEQESVPSEDEHALYIRPVMFGRDEVVKVGRSQTYTFYILGCIAGSYFQGAAAKGARILVNKQFVRAFPGGLGEAKTAGNYAASLAPQAYAATLKCDQVLYLDAIKHEFVDEMGGMNFFMVKDGELVTPPLRGTILHGVTRKSILEIAPTIGLKARETSIPFLEMLRDLKEGRVTEAFACGTAAVVHSIGEIVSQEGVGSPHTEHPFPKGTPVATKIFETLQAIQRGQIKAPGEWLFK